VQDYARRKGWSVQQAERWLAPNLAYEPKVQVAATEPEHEKVALSAD